MSYSAGMLDSCVTILNRREAKDSMYGVDGAGIEWEEAGSVFASVAWARGMRAMNAGAMDAYAGVLVRMRWNCMVNMRSRIVHEGVTYQILPETFHEDRRANTVQFNAQAIVNG